MSFCLGRGRRGARQLVRIQQAGEMQQVERQKERNRQPQSPRQRAQQLPGFATAEQMAHAHEEIPDNGAQCQQHQDFNHDDHARLPMDGGRSIAVGSRRGQRMVVWLSLLAMLVAAGLARLGVWQLDRAAYKTELLQRHAARSRLPAVALAALPAVATEAADRPVADQGHYDDHYTFLLDNQVRAGRMGFHVLTLFRTSMGGAVLVDRGWIPAGSQRNERPLLSPPRSTVLRGQVHVPQQAAVHLYTLRYDRLRRLDYLPALDLPVLAQALRLPLVPYVVRLDPVADDGFVRDWVVVADGRMGPEKHRAYAVQWFGLALAVVVIWLLLLYRHLTDKKND